MKLPNILFFLIDDLGHSDVGFTQIDPAATSTSSFTPNIDLIANSGVVLDRAYAYKTCTPSRSSLQSGRLPVHVTEMLKVPDDPTAAVPYNMTTITEILSEHTAYTSHLIGKWDSGMATTRHTPYGRGYSNSSLSYFSHKNDFYDHTTLQSGCKTECETQNPGDKPCIMDLWEGDHPATAIPQGEYVEHIFRDRALEIIDEEALRKDDPFFLLYASHIAHCPLQVPEDKLDDFLGKEGDDEALCSAQTERVNPDFEDPSKFECRATYEAMVSSLDDIVGEITQKLKATGLYDDTLIVFQSDNGGCVHLDESGGNNYPLRGGKYSDLEGGVRTAAFIGGGWLDGRLGEENGRRSGEILHIVDWYATIASLAGVDKETYESDERAKESNLPPIDSLNQAEMLFEGGGSAWTSKPLFLSSNAVILDEYKLILQNSVSPAGFPGETYPNASSYMSPVDDVKLNLNCSTGCLFNVVDDKSEHNDLAGEMPDVVERMKSILVEARSGFYENNDDLVLECEGDIGDSANCGCHIAMTKHGGYFGPYASG
mmetsp:Transcript_8331/g.16826  ORF Transcript_8331/g.16826 Transcript_8331/m.16826 type:complete len:542 (+) Transcript_8331:2-1627(+)